MKKIFIAVLIFRLVISFLPAMQIDMGAWQAWAMRMVEVGPAHFYSTQVFTDNPPGYLYVFWGIGAVREYLTNWSNLTNWLNGGGFEWLLKLPGNLFDLGTGVIIYRIIRGNRENKENKGDKWARWGFLLYTLNPAVWFNSSVFGQFDGAGAFFGLLSVYLLLEPISQRRDLTAVDRQRSLLPTYVGIRQIRLICAGVALACAWAVKPQAIALAPGVGILALREIGGISKAFLRIRGIRRIRGAVGEIIKMAGGFVLTTLLLYWPFFPKSPLSGIFYVFSRMNNIYSCTTCFAFNFWGIFGNWQNDQALFLGVPLLIWGIILGGLGMLGVLISSLRAIPSSLRAKRSHRKLRDPAEAGQSSYEIAASPDVRRDPRNDARIYLAIAISIMAFFMFVTRMHERYLLAFFPFMLIAGMLLKSKFLMLYYLVISGLSLLNVYYPYANYNPQYGLTPGLVVWLGEHFRALSMVSFGSFLGLWGWAQSSALRSGIGNFFRYKTLRGVASTPFVPQKFDTLPAPRGHALKENKFSKIILILILLFAFFSRVWRLDTPPTFYFDEVYHAFTAKEMLLGNKMAWEWWNTPPADSAGFAYEWTHPPLAKEMMVLGIGGIRVMREIGGIGLSDAFGWRFPGAMAGVGVILLIYLLGKQLFNVRVGLMAAFLGSCDGLLFTQSRIGMNDIYFLFFMLLAFYLFIRQISQIRQIGLIGMGVALGLALASKWTAIYGIGILGFLGGLGILGKLEKLGTKKIVLSTFYLLLSTLIIPLAVYLLTYLPFFQSGHSWAQFDELQHQMWWYHTGLKATHPYTSPWYSWPLMQRPVWYFVDYGKETVANIYGIGNPAIWWAGVAAVGYALLTFIKTAWGWVVGYGSGNEDKDGGKKSHNSQLTTHPLLIVFLGYFGFFLPWALSPRIMFLYHYLPSLPFMYLALGWALGKIWERGGVKITGKFLATFYLLLATLTFIYFYPQLSALPVAKAWSDQYFWFGSWR